MFQNRAFIRLEIWGIESVKSPNMNSQEIGWSAANLMLEHTVSGVRWRGVRTTVPREVILSRSAGDLLRQKAMLLRCETHGRES